jgi:hypothetical protein
MYNKKLLLTVLKDLNKAKKPTKKKDINYDATGKGMLNKNYAGKPVRLATDTLYNPTSYRINAKSDNGIEQTLEPYDETTVNFPGANYIDEYPEMKKGGGFSRNLLATNRLFKKNTLFKKNPLTKPNKLFKKKSYKRKTYDPMSMYFQDGGDTDAMNGMMKARLAYANEFGNPAAERMINLPDNPYQFENGDTGTHYMSSMDNYAVPQIQDENGQLMLGDYGPESSEAIRFDSDEDADYFAKNYKDVSPAFMELELTPEEIEEYKKGGYIVEEVNDPSIPKLGGFAKGGAQGCPQGTYWNGTKCTKLYTLKNDKKYIDGVANWAMHVSDPNKITSGYNDSIKERLYSGKWGLDPESGALVKLSAVQPQSVTTLDAKTKADREREKKEQEAQRIKRESQDTYRQSIIDAGFDPATFGKAKGVNTITGEPIYASSKEEAERINQEAINQFAIEGHAAVVNNPVFQAASYFTPWGMAIGAMRGAARLAPDTYNFAKDPSWSGAGQIAMDIAETTPFAKPIATATGKAINYVKNLEPAAPGPMMLMGRFADDVAKTGDDVAKVVSKAETPKSNFKSEIDWENWVKNKEDVVNNPDIIKELNTIEETTKANGTWMKNSDGTPFKGSPEQFVVQQSSRYKTAYPEGTDVVHRGVHKNSAPTSGTDQSSVVFTGDAPTAAQYIGHIDDVKRPLIKGLNENPLESPQNIITKYYDDAKNWTNQDPAETIQKEIFDAGKNLDDEVLGLYTPKTDNKIIIEGTESPGFNRAFNRLNVEKELGLNNNTLGQKEELQKFTNWMQENFPDRNLSDNVMTDHFAKYLNEGNSGLQRVDFNNITDPNILGNVQAMKVGPGNYLKSIRGNILFDMTNPDIYKAIIPTVGVAGTATMLANPFQGSDGLQQQQYGGSLHKFIEGGDRPCPPGQKYNTKTGKCEYILADHAPLNMLRDEKREKIERLDKFGNLTPILDEILPGSSYNPKYIQNLKEFAMTETPQWKKDRDKFGKDKIAFYESLFNPKKWGLNDYSDYSSYNSAFRNARESDEKEFVYKGKRYNTNLVPKEQSDLYWESKDFLKEYYETQPFIKDDSGTDISNLNNYQKQKYGFTTTELFDRGFDNLSAAENELLTKMMEEENAILKGELVNEVKYNSPVFIEKRKERLQKLDKPTYFSITTQKPKDMEEEGHWNEGKNKMFLNAKNDKLNTTYIHELSHKGDDSYESYEAAPPIDMNKFNKQNLRTSGWSQKDFDYISSPSEIESRKLSTLFYLHKNKKPWKAGKITTESLNNLYNNIDDLPFDVRQLLQLYDAQQDDLLNYLNSNYNYEKKKEGGAVNYQLGDEINEATMNELKRLGYTFEEI